MLPSPPVYDYELGRSSSAERGMAVAQAAARLQAKGLRCAGLSADLYEAFIAGELSLLELRYAVEGRYHRRHTPACWRLWCLTREQRVDLQPLPDCEAVHGGGVPNALVPT